MECASSCLIIYNDRQNHKEAARIKWLMVSFTIVIIKCISGAFLMFLAYFSKEFVCYYFRKGIHENAAHCKLLFPFWSSVPFYFDTSGLETYFFSHSQTFASGFNLNSQIAVSNSQLVFPTFEQFLTLRYGMPIVSWG